MFDAGILKFVSSVQLKLGDTDYVVSHFHTEAKAAEAHSVLLNSLGRNMDWETLEGDRTSILTT